MSDVFLSDTLGLVYRSFAPVYAYATGKPVSRLDPWTKNILVECESAGIIQASKGSIDAATATAQAQADLQAVDSLNQADCKPKTFSLATWILIIAMVAIVLVVGTKAFVDKEL